MLTVADRAGLAARLEIWRAQGKSIALVPTMGNLHAGHMALLDTAHERGQQVVASIFVNPTQFGPGEDFSRYPRTLKRDCELLAAHGCDLVFAPDEQAIYPFGIEHAASVHVPGLTEVLEGAFRPGHFDGVTTVVSRLLSLVRPDVAVFGRKDYQQWRVIERMVADFGWPVTIAAVPIKRAADGLALSSRNQYLSTAERQLAPRLQQTLQTMRDQWRAGEAREAIEQAALARLVECGFKPDYIVIRRAVDLGLPTVDERTGLVALTAARLGTTRLIDNLEFD